ncbi:hypothetical protein [Microbacterium sp. bgisy189]|uniref:hypothetical protein n=1 Tax=Microbacterium sp. bgisy189 TaxID=3413798 RepID=UPI003EBE6BBF
MTGHRYAFTSHWSVPLEVHACWAAIADAVERGETPWWPGVRLEPGPLRDGEERMLVVRSPLGYRLRVRVRFCEVDPPRRLAAHARGDLVGGGSIALTPAGSHGTLVTWVWTVRAHTQWMRLLEPVLRPVFGLAHATVMARGRRGLLRAVAHGSEPRNAGNPGLSSDRTPTAG